MKITTDERDQYAVVRVEGSLTNENQKYFEETLTRLLGEHQLVCIDFSTLVFITSSGLGILLSHNAAAQAENKMLALFGLNEDLAKLFKITELYNHLTVRDTLNECLEYAGQQNI